MSPYDLGALAGELVDYCAGADQGGKARVKDWTAIRCKFPNAFIDISSRDGYRMVSTETVNGIKTTITKPWKRSVARQTGILRE